MSADQYLLAKFFEWQQKGNGDYRIYVKKAGRYGLAQEFKSDPKFKSEVCEHLKAYAKGQEKESVLSIIQGIANPESDVLQIIVGAILDACGYPDYGNALISLGILALIGVTLIALLGSSD